MPGLFKRSKKAKVAPTVDLQKQEGPAGFEVTVSLLTDVGCVRDSNEDSGQYFKPEDPETLADRGLICVVADGMGGHSAGEVASRMAVDSIIRAYYESDADPMTALKEAVEEANREIYEASLKDESLNGMGTTCVVLALRNGLAYAAHVGDSRLYLVRDSKIYLMTEDHSAVMEMVKRGWISLEEARHHPDKNVILRAMGSQEQVEATTWDAPFPTREGDQFLLCSDGLYDLVEDEEMRQALLTAEPRSACEALIALAKQRGGHDNITIGIVSLKPEPREENVRVPTTREGAKVPETRELEVSK